VVAGFDLPDVGIPKAPRRVDEGYVPDAVYAADATKAKAYRPHFFGRQ